MDRNTTAAADTMIALLSMLTGGGSLMLFGLFLFMGSFSILPLGLGPVSAVALDALISLPFFLQHSLMVRRSFRQRLHDHVPDHWHAAAYSIASGVMLYGVMLLWQTSGKTVYDLQGVWRWGFRLVFLAAVLGFLWSARALYRFDALGVDQARRLNRSAGGMRLTFKGPYCWVRHPLYALTIMMIWSCPTVTTDRLLFNLLWTAWIVLGATLEELDLSVRFGDAYRRYQRSVPMLIPWKGQCKGGSAGDH